VQARSSSNLLQKVGVTVIDRSTQ